MMRARKQLPGFTLTELLVAIVILATLAGISYPLLRKGLREAQRSACLGNLRQIAIGLEAYLQDHGQRMPDLKVSRDDRSDNKPVLETVLSEYLTNPEVFHCPTDRVEFAKTGSSYGWNTIVSDRRLSRLEFFGIEETEEIPLVYDKENWHEGTGGRDNGTNILYADWTASKEIEFSVDE